MATIKNSIGEINSKLSERQEFPVVLYRLVMTSLYQKKPGGYYNDVDERENMGAR